MKIYIDTSDSERIKVGLDKYLVTVQSRREKSQVLLPTIDQLLKRHKMSIKDIDAIWVNTGPGSFTGIRIGVSVANALGFAQGVPVNGKDIASCGSIEPKYE